MLEDSLLAKVEQILSASWGGDVRLAIQSSFEDHPHVARLAVIRAPDSAPKTIYLKRWRVEGEDRYDPGSSTFLLQNDWASLAFLQEVMGSEPITPRLYAGNIDEGFLVLEDLAGEWPLGKLFQPGKSAEVAQVLDAYGKLLGILHGKTVGLQDHFIALRQRLGREFNSQPENYFDVFSYMVADLRRLGFEIPPSVLLDIQQSAGILTHPGDFAALTQGDAVFNNIISQQGRLHLIDFEVGRIRHALYEGVFMRMLFPTSGLLFVQRIPDPIWRQAEAVYRDTLSEYLPAAKDDAQYGSAITAASAFWILNFYATWLERALRSEITPERLTHLRRCIIARGEMFTATTREFQCQHHLGDYIASLIKQLRDQWPPSDCELPFYPAFQS